MKFLKHLLFMPLMLLAAPVFAQQSAIWNQPEVFTVVATFSTTMKIGPASPITLIPNCVQNILAGPPATQTTCTATLPSTSPPGTVMVLTESTSAGSVTGTATVPSAGPVIPGAPSGFKIVTTTTTTTTVGP